MRSLASYFNNAVIDAMYRDRWRCDVYPELFVAVRSNGEVETFWLYVGQDSERIKLPRMRELCKKIDAVAASHRRSWKARQVSSPTMSEPQLVAALGL